MAKLKKPDIAICLNCYSIKFKERNKPESETLSIKEVFGNEDIVKIYQDFIKTIDSKKVFLNKDENRVLYIKDTLRVSKPFSLVGAVIMKGHNGPETSIDELVKGEAKTVAKVTTGQFHCLPYFFLLHIKKENPHEIVFLAQSYKQFGFKEVFHEAFALFIKDKYGSDIIVKFNTLSIASLFDKYINDGKIYKLRFIKHGLSQGAESILCGDKRTELEEYETEVSIKSKSSKGFLGIKRKLKYDDASFIEQIQIDDFEFEDAYADVIIGGRKRTLNISRPTDFSAAYDITKDINIDPQTHLPNFTDVLKEAEKILKEDLAPYL